MTPLPRIRRRRTEEEPADQAPAADGTADAPSEADAETHVTTQFGASTGPPPAVAAIADAAALVHANVEPAAIVEEPALEDAPAVAATPPGEPAAEAVAKAASDAPAAATDENATTSEGEAVEEDEAEPAPPSAPRRFGLWVTGRSVGGEPEEEPETQTAEAAASDPPIAGAPATPAVGPSAKDRGRLRRRIRYLRRARELGFRDLGGLMFDQYRFRAPNQELLAAKLAALHALDSERRALEHILGERREFDDLREPGISACPNCGALHASDGRFCEVCGTRQIEGGAPPDA
jgi:ribosomal protein L32